jgi:hypothetical protein
MSDRAQRYRGRLEYRHDESNHDVPRVERQMRSSLRTKWAEIGVPVCLVLIISVPVMIVEESWHGRPMIDEGNHLWIAPALLVASAFLFGGALAGFRRPSNAVRRSVAVAVLALAILLSGAALRRSWVVHEGTQNAVLFLWCLGAMGSLVLSWIGSLFGRRLAILKA